MPDAVQQIKDRLNILDVVTPYVELHRAGKNFKGKSPFSNEKTPSFYVSPDRGMYYCFSTNQGGDIFTFVQAMEGVDFKEALKILAAKANVTLTPVSREAETEKERLYAALEAATQFYTAELSRHPTVRAYVENRGVSTATILAWQIGFAPGPREAGWRMVKEHLSKKGFTTDELLRAGLIKTTEQGKEPYDVFRNRVMFPLRDSSGRVVGFSGRTLDTDPGVPKYVNSPETVLYKKSDLLFGYDKAKSGIRTLDFSLLVEGQFDVVLSHQAGYTNTVAVSGTALTLAHVQMLERLSNKVVLALDADRAGIAAAKRAADIMLRRGLDVKVAELPLKDPADLVREDVKVYKRVIGASVHVIEFLLHRLAEEQLAPRVMKLRAREEVIPYIALLPNRIDQDHFEGIVADALGTTKDAVHFEVERITEEETSYKKQGVATISKGEGATPEVATQVLKTTILNFLLTAGKELTPLQVQKVEKEIVVISGVSIEELQNQIPLSLQAKAVVSSGEEVNAVTKKQRIAEVVHQLTVYRTLCLKERLSTAKQKLVEAETVTDGTVTEDLLKEVRTIQHELQQPPYDSTWLS